MSLVRITVDVETSEDLDSKKLAKIADSTRAYVNGSLTTISLSNDDKVGNEGAHIHRSTRDYACDQCVAHARDGLGS